MEDVDRVVGQPPGDVLDGVYGPVSASDHMVDRPDQQRRIDSQRVGQSIAVAGCQDFGQRGGRGVRHGQGPAERADVQWGQAAHESKGKRQCREPGLHSPGDRGESIYAA